MDDLREPSQYLRIQGIGLGQLPDGAGEVADLARIDRDHQQASGGQVATRGSSRPPVASTTMNAGGNACARWVAGAECQRTIYVESDGQPANRVAWTDPAVNAATSNFFLDTLETLENACVRPRHDGFVPFQEKAGYLIHDYLRDKGDEEAILDALDALYVDSGQNNTSSCRSWRVQWSRLFAFRVGAERREH